MFSFALYDEPAGRLLLARDRLGQKPLWYALLRDRLAFASEAKALLAHPHVDGQAERRSVTHYLTMGYIHSPRTAWTAIRKLPPAHRLLVGNAPGDPQPYWRPAETAPPADPPGRIAAVRSAVEHAVQERLIADVPLGALLSGGVDSSIVVALMARAAGRTGGVRTFTAGYDDARFDERPAAAQVARHCGTDHAEFLIRPDPQAALDAIVSMYDEPFGDSSALPTWLICREARGHVTVALTGDGGDEAFAGYDRHRAIHLADTMSPPRYLAVRIAAALASLIAPHDERSRLRRLVRFADALPLPFAMQYFLYRRLFGPEDLLGLLTDDFLEGLDVEEPSRWFCDLYEDADMEDEVARAQRHDVATYLPDDLLVKADIASMASSLELRSPMLAHDVVELGLSLPVEDKIAGRRGKAILRRAFGDLLPPDVFMRGKRGFAVPLGDWLKNELRKTMVDTLMDKGLERRGIFRRESLAGLINDHLRGRGDHRHRLWALMVLARWLAKYD
jgi:asparagine synthase (glutamine-hydrolysing)